VFLKKSILLLLSAIIIHNSYAQDSTNNSSTEKDINDYLKKIFSPNKKEDKTYEVKNLQVAALPIIGYSLQTGFAAVLTGNAGFSVNRRDSLQKLSTVVSSFSFSEKNQIIIPLIVNIWSKNNKYNFISDNRFLNYPIYTFGVGNEKEPQKNYDCGFSLLQFHESVLTKIANNTSVGIGFFYDKFFNIKGFDSIQPVINPNSVKPINTEVSSGLCARFLFDNRLNPINPNKGFFSNIIYRNNQTFLGSDNNWSTLIIDNRAYFPFPKNSKNVLALWNYNWLTFGNNISNFLLPSNGWDEMRNIARGYIQGRFRSKDLFSFEAEYRFRITKNGLIGATVFSNATHYSGEYFYKQNDIKLGGGMGLRIRFNKHTNSNVSIDYAWGQNGSRGFFVNVGEVF
jgi:hypothetical protein